MTRAVPASGAAGGRTSGSTLLEGIFSLLLAASLTYASVLWVTRLGGAPVEQAPSLLSEIATVEMVPPPPPPSLPQPSLDAPKEELSSPSEPAPTSPRPPPVAPSGLTTDALASPLPGSLPILPPLSMDRPMDGLPSWSDEPRSRSDEPATAASVVHRPSPRYPALAQRQGVEGHVVVRMQVDTQGRVRGVLVVESQPPGVFDAVAREAALRYRFRPARRGDAAISSTVEQRIVFRLSR